MHWLDPDFLPVTRGVVDRLVVNPHGDIDGFLMVDGTEVHAPPHLSSKLARALKPGAKVDVFGVLVRGGAPLVAVAIEPLGGKRIVDQGPTPKVAKPKPHEDDERWAYDGRIAHVLHGPKGDAHGVVLQDGVMVRFPPHAGHANGPMLRVGKPLAIEGRWLDTPYGAVVHADAMGAKPEAVTPLPKKPKH